MPAEAPVTRQAEEDGLLPGDFPLAILAKAPVPGRVKTRLLSRFDAREAARLHECLLRRTLATALEATAAERIVLWTALEHRHPLFLELAERHGIGLRPQPEGGLGARIQGALAAMPTPGLVIGSDCPVLGGELLQRCQAALATADGVFLPAEDGGYALVGLRHRGAPLFEGIDWGTSRVMAQTRTKAEALGWRLACPARVWDVDRPEDVDRWRALVATESPAPETGRERDPGEAMRNDRGER